MRFDDERRSLLAGAPVAAAMAALAGCAKGAGGKAGSGAQDILGPARTVAWAVGTTGSDFVLDISVGAADAAKMLGWRFMRVLNTQVTPEAHIDAIRQAVTSRADVVITVDWYTAVANEIAEGVKTGTRFAIVDSINDPDPLAALGVPFAGQEPQAMGEVIGARIAQALSERGVREGVVLVGNPFPGSANLVQRIQGIQDGLAKTSNGQAGTYRLVTFADSAAQDAAASVAAYKSKITETGDIVAHAVVGAEMSAVPLTTALTELNVAPGSLVIGGWASGLKMLDLVKEKRIDFVLDENLYSQGFMAVWAAWLMLERGMPALDLSGGYVMVTPQNVETMIASYAKRRTIARDYGLA